MYHGFKGFGQLPYLIPGAVDHLNSKIPTGNRFSLQGKLFERLENLHDEIDDDQSQQ